jgi:hypothetical protein
MQIGWFGKKTLLACLGGLNGSPENRLRVFEVLSDKSEGVRFESWLSHTGVLLL